MDAGGELRIVHLKENREAPPLISGFSFKKGTGSGADVPADGSAKVSQLGGGGTIEPKNDTAIIQHKLHDHSCIYANRLSTFVVSLNEELSSKCDMV